MTAPPEEGAPGEGTPRRIPVDGVLDLHTFSPREVTSVVEEYLLECRRRGIGHARLIHGKGKGVQRKAVRGLLEKLDVVEDYRDAPAEAGGWGATLVRLKPG